MKLEHTIESRKQEEELEEDQAENGMIKVGNKKEWNIVCYWEI